MSRSESSLRYYETYSRNDAKADRRLGETDGKLGVPKPEEKRFTGTLLGIVNRTENDISAYADSVGRTIAAVKQEHAEVQAQVDSYAGKRSNLLLERDDCREQVSTMLGPESAVYMQMEGQVKDVSRQLESVRNGELDRPLQAYMSRKLYFFTFFLLFLSEMPINIPAISSIFKNSLITSFLVATTLSMVMVYFAHTLGRLLRQPTIFKGGRWLYWLLLVALFVLSAGIIICVYLLRQDFIIQNSRGAIGSVLSAGWLFLLVNSAVFVAGVLVSVFHHDPNPDYQRLTYQHRDLEKQLNQLALKFNEALAVKNAEFDEKQRRMNLDYKALELSLSEKASKIATLSQMRNSKIERVLAVMGERVTAYFEGNREARGNTPQPECFTQDYLDLQKESLRKKYL